MTTLNALANRISQAPDRPSKTDIGGPAKTPPTLPPDAAAPGQTVANGALANKARMDSVRQLGPRVPLQVLVDKHPLHHRHAHAGHPHHRHPHLPQAGNPQTTSRARRKPQLSTRGAVDHEQEDFHEPDEHAMASPLLLRVLGKGDSSGFSFSQHQPQAPANEASQAQRAAKSESVRLQTGGPSAIGAAHRRSSGGRAGQGEINSFMNSLVRLAASALQKGIQLPPGKALDEPLLRQKLTEHLVETLAERNAAGGEEAGQPFAGPRAPRKAPPSDKFGSQALHRLLGPPLEAALGAALAQRCKDFSVEQKMQVLDLAAEPTGATGPQRARALSDILPALATQAFPKLRLEVQEPGMPPTTYGASEAEEPVHVIRRDSRTGLYEPAEQAVA